MVQDQVNGPHYKILVSIVLLASPQQAHEQQLGSGDLSPSLYVLLRCIQLIVCTYFSQRSVIKILTDFALPFSYDLNFSYAGCSTAPGGGTCTTPSRECIS